MRTFIIFTIIYVVLFVAFGYINTLIWAWVVPDVFSGMVKAGYLPASLSFQQSLKLNLLIFFLLGFGLFNAHPNKD